MSAVTNACVVCQQRHPERPQVCDPCRRRLAADMAELPELHAELPSVLARGQSGEQRVSGTREPPAPLRVEILDLMLPWRSPNPVRDPWRDQVGDVPIVAVLDSWVRDWLDIAALGDHQPVPTVPVLAGWLAVRLDWACDRHPAVDEFASEVRDMLGALRAVLGVLPLRHRLAAPCPSCDLRLIFRDDGADWVECGGCGRLWSEDEYAWLARIVAAELAEGAAA